MVGLDQIRRGKPEEAIYRYKLYALRSIGVFGHRGAADAVVTVGDLRGPPDTEAPAPPPGGDTGGLATADTPLSANRENAVANDS